MSQDDIARMVESFRSAALRAREAGFQIVEIHGAHGYLIHEFYSPTVNQRTDQYGGSRAARMRFALEIAEAVRGVWPDDLPVWFRASAVDGAGIEIEDTVALAQSLKERGIDLIDCSSGGLATSLALAGSFPGPGFQVPYAKAVRDGAGIATMAVGFITEPEQAEQILGDGSADLIALGRELMANPNWVFSAAKALGHPTPHSVLPPSYGFFLERRDAAMGGSK